MISLSLDKHVANVRSSGFYWLRQLRRVRRSLDTDSIKTLVHAFVTSRVDYCNAVFAGSPRYITDKLQCVLIAAVHLVNGTRKLDHGLKSQCIAVCSTRLLSTWSTAVHQSQTFPANVIYGQPLNITWPYHVTGSALSLIRPSLLQVW